MINNMEQTNYTYQKQQAEKEYLEMKRKSRELLAKIKESNKLDDNLFQKVDYILSMKTEQKSLKDMGMDMDNIY